MAMTLYNNRPSPYGRKVLVVAYEKQLMRQIVLHQVDPWSDPADLLAANPLCKVPALLTDDGRLITESSVISEYFDTVGTGPRLIGDDRFDVMSRIGLAQGLIDAAFASVIERRRPAERQWSSWLDRQRRAIERTLTRARTMDGRFDLGDISLACGLAYLDFRLPDIGWRNEAPDLAAWLDEIAKRPSMQATAP